MGGRADATCRQGIEQSRPQGARDILRRARVALHLSVAAAARWPGRSRVRRTGEALAADPRCLRRGRRRSLLRNPSRRGPARRRHLRNVPRQGRTITRAATSCSIPAISSCSSSTIWSTSTSITSASRCFTSRTPSSIPPGAQGVYGGFQPWIDRAGRFRSLGDGQVDFRSNLLQADAVRISTAGRCWNGNAASRAPNRAPPKAPLHRPPHHPGGRPRAFDDFAASGTDRRPTAACSAWVVIDLRRHLREAHGRQNGRPEMHGAFRLGDGTEGGAPDGHRWQERCYDEAQGCASAWSAADPAPSSAPSTASPRGIDDRYELVAAALASDPERAPSRRRRGRHRSRSRLRQFRGDG